MAQKKGTVGSKKANAAQSKVKRSRER